MSAIKLHKEEKKDQASEDFSATKSEETTMRKHGKTWGIIALSFVALVLLFSVGAPRASAQTITIDLVSSNLTGATGPFATVSINRTDSTHATVTFTADPGYQIIDSQAADLNVSGSFVVVPSSYTVSQLDTFNTQNPTDSKHGWTQSINSNGSVDGFGNFNFQLNLQDGSGSAVNSLSFVLSAIDGNSWASAADVLTPNSLGYEAAVHIAICSGSPCTIENTGIGPNSTGYASTPELGMLSLFGTGLLGIAALIRRHMNVSRK